MTTTNATTPKPKSKRLRVRDAEVSTLTTQLALDTFGDGDTHPLKLMLDRRMTRREEQVVLNAAARIMRTRFQPKKSMASPKDAAEFFKSQLAHLAHEVFCVMFLDSRHGIIDTQVLFQGTIDGAEIHTRVVVARALELGAAAMLVSHNHPSGNPEPSAADRAVTAQLKQALALVDVRLLDHIVVAGTTTCSLAARGWL